MNFKKNYSIETFLEVSKDFEVSNSRPEVKDEIRRVRGQCERQLEKPTLIVGDLQLLINSVQRVMRFY